MLRRRRRGSPREIAVAQAGLADEASPSSGEVLDFMRVVWALDSGLEAVSGEMAAIFDLSAPQRLVLRVLAEYPPLSPSELTEIIGIQRTRMTSVLRRLEDAGYLRRRADPADRRRTIVTLTPRGLKISEALASVVEAAVRNVLCKVTGRTVDSAKQVLSALASELAGAAGLARNKG
jgi:DNA-binding MarR family transcriptional regulator